MKVVVLGASGMAGHVVALYLRENGFDVDTVSGNNKLDHNTQLINVLDQKKLKRFLEEHAYDAVINCIGLLVAPSEARKDLAVFINSYLPHLLETHYSDTNTKVIHMSTDDVMIGEDSIPEDKRSFYARSKALGELNNNKDLSLRMSIIGPDMRANGPSLFNWFMAQKGEVSGYTKYIWNGITTIELAKGTKAALEQNLSGIYELVPKTGISKYNLLKLFKETFNKNGVELKAAGGTPANKILHNTRRDFDYEVPGYQTMIEEMKAWVDNHPELYKHYE